MAGCAALLIGLDQIFKMLAVRFLIPGNSFEVVAGILNMTYTENTGAAFGIFSDSKWFLIITHLLVLGAGIFIFYKKKEKTLFLNICAVMIISGGIGNLIDRIARGYVVDFIDLMFFPFENFAIFNFADCMVVIGTIMLTLYLFIIDPLQQQRSGQSTINSEQETKL